MTSSSNPKISSSDPATGAFSVSATTTERIEVTDIVCDMFIFLKSLGHDILYAGARWSYSFFSEEKGFYYIKLCVAK